MVTLGSLERLAEIAMRAGEAIQNVVCVSADVVFKEDSSPLTRADMASHDLIVGALTGWDPSIPVISEESEAPAYDDRRAWPRFWLVDPLDGTKEFLAGFDDYTVNIALIEGDAPVLGVVFAPAQSLLYLGGRGIGAWKQEAAGARQQVWSSPAPAGQPVAVVESRSHRSAELDDFVRTLPVRARVQAGSSLKFCRLAEGEADVYPRFTPIMEWDTAAGDCIFRASGRHGPRTSPLRYNTPTLKFERFVIGLT